jgi:hypothetical protein
MDDDPSALRHRGTTPKGVHAVENDPIPCGVDRLDDQPRTPAHSLDSHPERSVTSGANSCATHPRLVMRGEPDQGHRRPVFANDSWIRDRTWHYIQRPMNRLVSSPLSELHGNAFYNRPLQVGVYD